VTDASSEAGLFRTFWSNGRAWGVYTQRQDPADGRWRPELEVLGGDLDDIHVTLHKQEIEIGKGN